MRAFILLLIGISFSAVVYSQTVFKTPSGNKYHLASCRMVKNVSEEISVEKAAELGLTPCKICKPDNIYSSAQEVNHKAQGQNTSVQCHGLTKTGSRCRHMTKIANGFCFQHQPKN